MACQRANDKEVHLRKSQLIYLAINRSVLTTISLTSLWNGSFPIDSSVLFKTDLRFQSSTVAALQEVAEADLVLCAVKLKDPPSIVF
ncbi:hypothetical protein ACOSP7_028412 [Xanthoceras sorbifolium]